MKCCIPNCANSDTLKKSRCSKITFHEFPKTSEEYETWVKALGLTDVSLSDEALICSEHFNTEDLQITKGGAMKVKTGAVPYILQICKVCLAVNIKMYNLQSYRKLKNGEYTKLSYLYEDITGIPCKSDENSRLLMCWECTARLVNAAEFKSKALRSNGLLQNMFETNINIKLKDITSAVIKHNLNSCLTIEKVFDTEEVYRDDVNELKIECENDGFSMKSNESIEINDKMDIVKNEVHLIPVNEEIDNYQFDYNYDNHNDNVDNDNDLIDNNIDTLDDLNDAPVLNDFDDDSAALADREEKIKKKTSRERSKKKNANPRQPIDENVLTVTSLSMERLIEEVEKRRESARYKLSAYKCDVCYTGFPSEDKYTRHAVKHSEESGKYECVICKIRTKKMHIMRSHMNRQHTEEFSCKLCPLVTRSRTVALGHIRFHAGKKFVCPQCSKVFEKHTTYLNHLRLNHLSGYVCSLCGYMFVSMNGVLAHKRKKHVLVDKHIEMLGPYCKVCDVKFLSKQAYDKHLRLSSKHIEGEDDPVRLSNDPTIRKRLMVGRKKPERRPDIRPRDPNSKMRKATDPVDCEQCGLHLPNLQEYTAHFKTSHPGIHRSQFANITNPYMCEQCGKMFQNSTTLENHQWVHTGVKRYQCDHCNKTFSVKANLAGHMRLHTPVRQTFPCKVCGKTFAFSFNRTRHMFLHTGLKPYKCEACEKCFVTSDELRSHIDYVHLKKPRPKRVRRKPRKIDNLDN